MKSLRPVIIISGILSLIGIAVAAFFIFSDKFIGIEAGTA